MLLIDDRCTYIGHRIECLEVNVLGAPVLNFVLYSPSILILFYQFLSLLTFQMLSTHTKDATTTKALYFGTRILRRSMDTRLLLPFGIENQHKGLMLVTEHVLLYWNHALGISICSRCMDDGPRQVD